MPESPISTSTVMETNSSSYVHSVSEAGRLLPSASRWNSIEIDFNLTPKSSISFDNTVNKYSKSIQFNLIITNKKTFRRFIYISISLILLILAIILLLHFLSHKHDHHGSSKNLTLALSQALVFFDAQKSGFLPTNNSVKFRGDSGLKDGNSSNVQANLVGGFYDSGNNVKYSFSTAYTITLLSWSVIEYHQKYEDIGELDHIKSIIKWGSDYLLKVFVPPNSTHPSILFSQVGSTNSSSKKDNDITCWQKPEDMSYPRPVSICRDTASDLAGEIVAALSAASLVFKEEKAYSERLIETAERLFGAATGSHVKKGMYTMDDYCGGEARQFYNSSGYLDELAWGGTWLFLATGNTSHLGTATENFVAAVEEELLAHDNGVFYWNNKLAANAVLLARLRYFHDPGNTYGDTMRSSSNMSDLLMCSYLSQDTFNRTPGGLILLRPDYSGPLQYAATASFLTKLYSDYLYMIRIPGVKCSSDYTLTMLQRFSMSQVNYILGSNPMKISYLVGFGDHFPSQVHHRAASIPSDNQWHSCAEGKKWLNSKDSNPNTLLGAMVAGPDQYDKFFNERYKPEYTEPSISSNAGLVAALIALHDPPRDSSPFNSINGGIDQKGIFTNIHAV